jgi:glycosyltransferase involved in cell wall biosynthesis
MPQPPLRILYAAGPGDIIGTYHHWKAGRDDPSQVAITYSSQFYDLCRERGATGYAISYHPRKERVVDGALTIEHRPRRFRSAPGPLYHLGMIWYGVGLAISAARFHADVAIVSDGTHWFTLGLMRMLGVRVVPSLHCVLWLKHRPPSGFVPRLIQRLNARFFRRRATAILSLSHDITQQLPPALNGHPAPPIISFLPTYRRETFAGVAPPPPLPPFRVFFAGRIERNKGVFDLLEIAKRFKADGRTDIEFDLCGDGSALPALRQAAVDAELSERFRCHGHSTQPFMRQMYQQCHVVVAPTTSEFVEGFNKVVAEGVLAGRPVITSSVCPALEYVAPAVVEVPPDNPAAYGDAILQLYEDKALREAKHQGCATVAPQFYDASRSWKTAADRAVGKAPETATD